MTTGSQALLGRWLLPMVAFLAAASCSDAASRQVQRSRTVETARATVKKAPCALLAAVADALRGSSGGSGNSGWNISFNGGCCKEPSKIELHASLVGFQFDPQPDLIGWNVRCPVGIGGPVVKKSSEVLFHYLELLEKDERTLLFALVPAWRTFDANGNKVEETVQGCPDVSGVARISSQSF